MAYTNSPLVSYKKLSPNHSGERNHKIDTITIHCVVGQVTVKRLGEIFASKSRQASSNYGVGLDGKIGLYVEEKNRSWCTSSRENDHRAVTIEVASDTKSPYKVKAKAYEALVDLVTDICKRNGKKKAVWFGDKKKTLSYKPAADEMVLTVHRWFANKACPGDYLYGKHATLVAEVNKRLGVVEKKTETKKPAFKSYQVKVTAKSLNIRKGPGTNYAKNGAIKDKGIYTIIDESTGKGSKKGWAKLKSGAGWISLDYCTKVK